MTRWREAFYLYTPTDNIDKIDKTPRLPPSGGGFVDIVDIVIGGMEGEGARSRPVVGPDGADPHPPGARLIVRHLWPRGIEVKAEDGAVVLVAPPHRPRIPPVLVAAVRRHLPAVAAWAGAPPGAGLVLELTP